MPSRARLPPQVDRHEQGDDIRSASTATLPRAADAPTLVIRQMGRTSAQGRLLKEATYGYSRLDFFFSRERARLLKFVRASLVSVRLGPAANLTSVTLKPTTVVQGTPSVGTVTLDAPAP